MRKRERLIAAYRRALADKWALRGERDALRRELFELRAQHIALAGEFLKLKRVHVAEQAVLAEHTRTIQTLSECCAHAGASGHEYGLQTVRHLLHHGGSRG